MKHHLVKQKYSTLKKKSNRLYTRGITPKRVTIGETHLRGRAPEQYSSEEIS